MIRKTLISLSIIGLLLSVGLWGVSCSGGWSHTHFYIVQGGEEIGITFICADGRIGWDEAGDMCDSVLSPDHGVSLWLPTVVLVGSFLLSLLLRDYGTMLLTVLRVIPTMSALLGLLLSLGAWGASYAWVGYFSSSRNEKIYLYVGQICWYDFDVSQVNNIYQVTMPQEGLTTHGFQGLQTDWLPSFGRGRYTNQLMSARIPLWIPTAAFILLFVICRPFTRHHRRKRKKLGLCLNCGYDLRGSKDRCPECGAGFSN